MSEQLLRLDHITMQFGGVVAVDDLELEVNEGEIVALIGPNGAGKTTAFNVITGVYQPTNGAVWFDGAKIIENHPQGKMKKQYKGQCDGLFTETLSPSPDKITRSGMAGPSRTSVCGRPRRCSTMCSSPSIAAPPAACFPPRSG